MSAAEGRLSAKALYEQRKKYSNSNVITQETSQYHVEHLATFAMDKSESVVTIDDGIKKLVQLDIKGKVWTQEMLLQVNDKSIRLLDCESQDELENFPLNTVHHCQNVHNQSKYQSVLLFICQDSDQHKPDIHFFNCDEVGAEMIHADVESAISDCKGGQKIRPQTLKVNQEKMKKQRETIIPSPPHTAPPAQPPGINKSRAAALTTQNDQVEHDRKNLGPQEHEEPPEVMVHRIEKDVQILNCTLDDIEFFVAKLQKAAEAYHQLNQRKKSKKNKKKAPAEGMLTLRAKPPLPGEFTDCFQKIKLTLNLLAKLKKHIQNPNAVELLHFLFGPLEVVINGTGGPEIARTIISPLLSKDATEFLRGHLTPKEISLWEALGEAWTRSRADWPRDHHVPPYVPKFRNGWEPPLENFRGVPWELDARQGPEATIDTQRRQEEMRRPSVEQSAAPSFPPPNGYEYGNTSFKRGQIGDQNFAVEAFKQSVSRPEDRNYEAQGIHLPKKYVQIVYDFVARSANELSVLKDEILEVVEENKQWWKLKSKLDEVGYVPFNVLTPVNLEDIPSQSDNPYSMGGQRYKGEMSARGMGPGAPFTTPGHMRHGSHELPGIANRLFGRDKEQIMTQMDEVNDELRHVIIAQKTKPGTRNFQVPKQSVIQVPLGYESSSEDVRSWLEVKGFSKSTVSGLGILTGAQIFSLNKEELKLVCGEEGARVYSLIQVQKAELDKHRGDTELEEIMKRRQERIDSNN
ncbi:epidermal growth factor receptor kinase substrate 8-like protein 2 [Pristis pectinata]|uniref:epidermal growth factor receptor kinase substrate 8-like protein 2 n=1 Tax=Pristis pectinata TaxID=685728 RepID=UPI00223CEBAB|nr:epidermal growth factor receptor kinase substrate 8-like protein 2 [Pristis pectinata]XP_051884884.1 epidermal growth factor receptor kinase substrate 8-like protein 2 [Pristis pectinata]